MYLIVFSSYFHVLIIYCKLSCLVFCCLLRHSSLCLLCSYLHVEYCLMKQQSITVPHISLSTNYCRMKAQSQRPHQKHQKNRLMTKYQNITFIIGFYKVLSLCDCCDWVTKALHAEKCYPWRQSSSISKLGKIT